MAKYLLLYQIDPTKAAMLAETTPEQAEAGMQQWMAWFGKAGDAVVDMGAPLAPVGTAAPLGGYTVVEAADEAALSTLLEGHPHLEVGTIDAHEFQAIPGM